MTTHERDIRLRAANPVGEVAALPESVIAAEVHAIAAATPPADRVPRRRRPRRRTALLAALALLVAVPGAAGAIEAAGIHTGWFPSAGDTESAPGEEYLDTGSRAIVPVVRELSARLPLPAGDSWAPLLARWPDPEGALMQRSGIGAEVEWYARCRWQAAWLRANRAGDPDAAAASAAVLRSAASWPFTVATDGGGVVTSQRAVAAAAAAGDAGRVHADHRANCAA